MSSPSSSRASSLNESYEEASDYNKYRLRVTAGCDYDASTHVVVPVNQAEALTFENDHIIMSLAVRIRGFDGFPDNSPETCPYFEHALHRSDQYSIAFSFIPKNDINGDDLVFGNDFDRPIRDRLPPGFKQAMRIVKWWIDPGLDGDPYADKPYLYGTALSSWNYFRIGEKILYENQHEVDTETEIERKDSNEPFPALDSVDEDAKFAWKLQNDETFHETVIEEGADGSGNEIRTEQGLPGESAGRMKFFLTQTNRSNFVFEKGRQYQADFGNSYLNFNDFSLKLPGFSIRVIKYVDSKTHELRYVLKNRKTGDVYAVILFTLLFGEQLKDETGRSRANSSLPPHSPTATSHAEGQKASHPDQRKGSADSKGVNEESAPGSPEVTHSANIEALKIADHSDSGESATNRSRSNSKLNNLKAKKDDLAARSRSGSLFAGLKRDKDRDGSGSRSRANSGRSTQPKSSPPGSPARPAMTSRTSTKSRLFGGKTEDKKVEPAKKEKPSVSDHESIPSTDDEVD